jgi:hypothetical protein
MDVGLIVGVLGVIIGIIGVLSPFLWDKLKGKLGYISSDFPDIRGTWLSTTSIAEMTFQEKVIVTKQAGREFWGIYETPTMEEQGEVIELEFEGFLMSPLIARFWYKPSGKGKKVTDYGVGLLQLQHDHKRANGAAIGIGVISEHPDMAQLKLEKQAQGAN